MATTVARLEAVLSANTRDFDQAMDKSQSKTQKYAGIIGKAGLAIGGALVGSAIVGVKAASNLDEQLNKTAVVFRGSEKEVHAWSKTLTRDFGLSSRAALEASGVYGNMLVPMGFARTEAAKMSMRMTELAGDMASFNNANPEETLDALRAGLAGETEPLRRFGVFLNDARLKEEAMRLGLYKGVGALNAAAKAQATYSIILKDTKDAQGDFSRTSGGLANQQRILRAQLENLAAQMGTALIPILQKVATAMSKAGEFLSAHPNLAKGLAVALGVLAAAMVAVWVATLAMNLAFLASPIGLIVLAVVGLVAGFVLLYKKSELFRDIIDVIWDLLKKSPLGFLIRSLDDVAEAVPKVIGALGDIITWFTELPGKIGTEIGRITSKIGEFFTGAYNKAKELGGKIITGAKDGVLGIGEAVWGVVDNIFTRIVAGWATIIGWGMSVGTRVKQGAVDAVLGIGNAVWNVVNNIWEFILERIDTVKGWGTSVGNWLKNAVVAAVVGIGSAVWGIVNNIWEFIYEKIETIKGWGEKIGTWIKNAIVDGISGLGSAVANKLKSEAKGFFDPRRGIPGLDPSGDPDNPFSSAGAAGAVFAGGGVPDLHGANPELGPFARAAAAFGLTLTSGRWDHSKYTRSGNISDHWLGKAIDVSNGWDTPQMAAFFRSLIGNPRVKQAFYDPLGSIFGGVLSSYREGGHTNHVHVATYDLPGWKTLQRGWNMIGNFTGRPEPVYAAGRGGGPSQPIIINLGGIVHDRQEVARWLQGVIRGAGRDGIIIDQPQPGF